MKNKKEKLATLLRAFIKQVEQDINFKKNIYPQYEWGESEAITRFEHQAWFLCQPADEVRARQNLRRKLQKKPDFSTAEGKLDSLVFPFFDKWTKKTLLQDELIQEEHCYTFWPDEKTNVKMFLKQLKDIIDHSKKIFEVRATKSLRRYIIDNLFTAADR